MSASSDSLPKIKLSIKLPSQRTTPVGAGAQTPIPVGEGNANGSENINDEQEPQQSISATATDDGQPKVKIRLKLGQLKEDQAKSKAKKRKSSTGDAKAAADSTDRPTKTARPVKKKNMYTVMQQCIVDFVKRDSYGFFLTPVDTNLVSDYLSVIKHPMDFETMRRKIDERKYSSYEDFKNDFYLICRNAMTYNAPETIFYKSAEKLEAYGRKHLEKQQRFVADDVDFKEDEGQTEAGGGGSGEDKIDLSKVSQIVQQHQRDLQTIQLLQLQHQQREQQQQLAVAAVAPGAADETTKSSPKKQRRQYSKRQSIVPTRNYLLDGSVEPGEDYYDFILPTLYFPFNVAHRRKPSASSVVDAGDEYEVDFTRGYLDYGPYRATQLNPAFGHSGSAIRPITASEHHFALTVCGDAVGEAYMDSVKRFTSCIESPAVRAKLNQRINELTLGGGYAVERVECILKGSPVDDSVVDGPAVPEEFRQFNYEAEAQRVQNYEQLFANLGPWLQPRYDRIEPAMIVGSTVPSSSRVISTQEELKTALAEVNEMINQSSSGMSVNIELIRQTLAGILRWVPSNEIAKPPSQPAMSQQSSSQMSSHQQQHHQYPHSNAHNRPQQQQPQQQHYAQQPPQHQQQFYNQHQQLNQQQQHQHYYNQQQQQQQMMHANQSIPSYPPNQTFSRQ